MTWPVLIQGGMGAGVSGWRLASAVGRLGHLGVVSGTALDVGLARRLQDGDLGGHLRRVFDRFPFPALANRVWKAWFRAGGRPPGTPYRQVPLFELEPPRALLELCVVANFVEVTLARTGHNGPIGINYLEKIALPHLPSLYGALLAHVDYVIVGAGMPGKFPAAIEALRHHQPAVYPVPISGQGGAGAAVMTFSPDALADHRHACLPRPKFLVIVASNVLAERLARGDGVDGFIVELPVAGGHNAPPRNPGPRTPAGEPVYGEKDRIDWERFRALGKPFWAAGGCATPEKFAEVRAAGATGVQIGTAFAFCAESGLDERYKAALLQKVRERTARVFTDPDASPTGYPFKVAELEGSLSDAAVYAARRRMCDLGFLREAYRKPDGGVGFRCPAEPVDAFVAKGGAPERTIGRKCLCNGLMANIGLGQRRAEGAIEPPLLTAGDDLTALARFLKPGARSYAAADVVRAVLEPAVLAA